MWQEVNQRLGEGLGHSKVHLGTGGRQHGGDKEEVTERGGQPNMSLCRETKTEKD